MKTEMREKTKRRAVWGGGLSVLALGLYVLSGSVKLQEPGLTEPGQPESGALSSAAPRALEAGLALSAETDNQQLGGDLPLDAGMHQTEHVQWGGQTLEVMAHELVVRFSPALSDAGRTQLLAQLGARVLEEQGAYVRLKLNPDVSILTAQQRLAQTEGVSLARPNVVMSGAANKCNTTGSYYGYQWHLNRFNHATTCANQNDDPTPVTVAVLDTGVAYESYGGYVKASSLTGVPVVNPYDFVNEDSHANDDHQHGTHVATTILGMGSINGVTPGASLMPVKVLDANNKGNEFDLAQGLNWAVSKGAKIINMSLSFPKGYTPSGLLQEAVSRASEAGILMIASTGNAGTEGVPYPAAFREVLSVGATRMKRMSGGVVVDELASYSNYGPGIDLVAPGGSLQYDANLDGWPDGILAQSIRYQAPSQTSYFFYSGTSQAAALVSGVATWMMATGASASLTRDALLQTATDLGEQGYDTLYGQGLVNLNAAVSFIAAQTPTLTPGLYVNILPVMYKYAGSEYAVARVRVTRETGTPVANARIYGTWTGAASSYVTAVTDNQGYLTVSSPWVADDADGSLFALEIYTIIDPATGRRVKPKESYYMSRGLSALLQGALDAYQTEESLIAFEVLPSDTSLHSIFNASRLARSFSVKALGPTFGTPGIGITFSPDFIPGLEDMSLPSQALTISFGGPLAFGYGVSSSGTVITYSGGVGLATIGFSRGVGIRSLTFGISGGVGIASLSLSSIRMDVSLITGMSADGSAAELVRSEEPGSFLNANIALSGEGVLFSLNDTRFAANSIDTASMEAMLVVTAQGEEGSLMDVEMGMVEGAFELGEELPTGLITEE